MLLWKNIHHVDYLMTLKWLKHAAFGITCYAAGMYLLKIANSKLDATINEGFRWD